MAGMKLFEAVRGPVEWEYDAEADTLYVSFGSPRPAVGIDIGVGLTIVGIGCRMKESAAPGRSRGSGT